MSTVFITGCSTGIGAATARLFSERGWTVIATMRQPEQNSDLSSLSNVHLLSLDVTDSNSVADAISRALEIAPIDVLVNNAGYGAYGPLESTPKASVERLFQTNLLGLIDVTKAVLPHMRERGTGTIVNVSSMGGRIAWPLGSLYHASKFAVEGLSEALQYELDTVGVSVKIVQPGRVATDFSTRSADINVDPEVTEYQKVIQALLATSAKENYRSDALLPAETIYRAATDGTNQLRYTSGEDAEAGMQQRAQMDDEELFAQIRAEFGLD